MKTAPEIMRATERLQQPAMAPTPSPLRPPSPMFGKCRLKLELAEELSIRAESEDWDTARRKIDAAVLMAMPLCLSIVRWALARNGDIKAKNERYEHSLLVLKMAAKESFERWVLHEKLKRYRT
jgi:hypothetical protein